MSHLARAVAEGHAALDAQTGTISYLAAGRTAKHSDPEEQVRAEFWAELIYVYGYAVGRLGVEVVVPDRTPVDRADLVVFHDDRRTRPYAVIECKRDGISDAEFEQAIEQAAGNGTWSKLRADYVMVVAGATRRTLEFSERYGILERENNIVADLPRAYGKPQEYKYSRGGDFDLQAVSRGELITTLRKCHQSLWGGGKLSPPSAFGELAKLIFVKISDEQSPRMIGEPYQFQIRTHESAARLAVRIRELYGAQRRREPEVFTEDIRVSDEVLRTIVSHLESISLTDTDVDVKGVAFETFMDNFFKGDYGQFFTPREVIELAVQMLEPTHDHKVMDPACGSAGFLLHTLTHVRMAAARYFDPGSVEHHRYWHDFATQNLFGLEINEEIARIAKMNMILHGDGHTNVTCADALQPIAHLTQRNPGIVDESFDIVLTNPPFGAQVALSEKPYLATYQLATQGARVRRNQKTEILFLERVWQLLKSGSGRAAVVLPDGLLTNSSLQYVRDYLLERFFLLAVVSLPQTTFMHFGTGVKASLVILRKRSPDEEVDPNDVTFMAVAESVGYDAVGRSAANDLHEVLQQWRKFMTSPESFATS